MALTFETRLLDSPDYPEDVKKRACAILNGCQGQSVGSYTDSAGLEVVRRQVAQYIEKRDGGIASNWQDIYLTGGASPGIKSILSMIKYVARANIFIVHDVALLLSRLIS